MGKYNFRPARVLQTANQLLETNHISHAPPWYKVLTDVPPGEILVRPIHRTRNQGRNRKNKKPSRMFQPVEIKYPEDRLRSEFFGDHPWELARPKTVLEDSGNDARHWSWEKLEQIGKPVDGESVVQRQMWLMENDTPKEGEPTDWQSVKERAYDQARKEFYKLRLEEDVERQVLREEALYVGAYFGKSHIDIGMELEEKQWQKWKTWALKEIERQGHERMAAESNAKLGTEEDANPSLIDALSEEEEATV